MNNLLPVNCFPQPQHILPYFCIVFYQLLPEGIFNWVTSHSNILLNIPIFTILWSNGSKQKNFEQSQGFKFSSDTIQTAGTTGREPLVHINIWWGWLTTNLLIKNDSLVRSTKVRSNCLASYFQFEDQCRYSNEPSSLNC